MGEVVSVGVLDAERYRDVLTKGALPARPAPAGPPVTRLAARTRVDELGRRAWDGIAAVRVEHRPGEGLAVRRVPDDALLITADLAAALPRRLDAQLDGGLNAVL